MYVAETITIIWQNHLRYPWTKISEFYNSKRAVLLYTIRGKQPVSPIKCLCLRAYVTVVSDSSPVVFIREIQPRERWVPRKGVQGLLPFSLPIILCSSSSHSAVCYMKTGDESAVVSSGDMAGISIRLSANQCVSKLCVCRPCSHWT